MRNDWFPRRVAEYVTQTQQSELRTKNVTAERDFQFGISDAAAAAIAASSSSTPAQARKPATKSVDLDRLTVSLLSSHILLFPQTPSSPRKPQLTIPLPARTPNRSPPAPPPQNPNIPPPTYSPHNARPNTGLTTSTNPPTTALPRHLLSSSRPPLRTLLSTETRISSFVRRQRNSNLRISKHRRRSSSHESRACRKRRSL